MSASKHEHQPTEDISAYYALHVALQTMKERCNALQQRLVHVENENINLSMKEPERQFNNEENGRNEIEILRMKVSELTKQKSQLAEHISMVATENRQLWRRLTKLTKDGQSVDDIQAAFKDLTTNSITNSTHQNLIRSKTFTQNSPNPLLRQKMNISAQGSGGDENSLEEISLKVLNDFLEGKAEFEKKCSEIIPPMPMVKPNILGFGYLNEETADADLQNDAKKCADGMLEIKKELLRQQSDLKVALSSLRQRKVLEVCSTCKAHSSKPTTADKIIETEDILTDRMDEREIVTKSFTDNTVVQIDFVEQKRVADCVDKMCPLCGKIYSSSVKFDDFQEHVESHFIDDSELDTNIERNYEIISHAVGHF